MSENIFTEIYNKILGLFGQPVVKDESKNTAVNRLRLVLMQDRTNLTPEIMNRMRSELIEVLSKYVELDKEALDLNIGQEGEQMALMLSIPVIRAKDEAEIQEALKKEDEAKKLLEEKEESEEDEDENSEESTDEESSQESEETENSEEDTDNEEAGTDDEEEETEKTEEVNDENSDSEPEKPKRTRKKKEEPEQSEEQDNN